MESSKNALERILTAVDRLNEAIEHAQNRSLTAEEEENLTRAEQYAKNFDEAMDDDFNTADAVSAIFELVKLSNSTASLESTRAYLEKLKEMISSLCDILGIITQRKKENLDAEVEKLIEMRQAARKEKNFARADEIRDQLIEMGIILEDTREGVKWRRA